MSPVPPPRGVSAGVLIAVPGALALTVGSLPAMESPLASVDFHGSISQGYLVSTANDYLADTSDGSFEFNEFLLNASCDLSSSLRIGLQLFSRDVGDVGDNRIELDWAHADYSHADDDWLLGLRLGRVKPLGGFYNDIQDLDACRTPVLLPQGVYDITIRDVSMAVDGGEIYGSYEPRAFGRFEVSFCAGHMQPRDGMEKYADSFGIMQTEELTAESSADGTIRWETPWEGLRLGYSWFLLHDLRGHGPAGVLMQAARYQVGQQAVLLGGGDPNDPLQVMSALQALGLDPTGRVDWHMEDYQRHYISIEYRRMDWTITAEYMRAIGRNDRDGDPILAEVLPDRFVSDGGYLMASWRCLSDWELSAYYSGFWRDVDDRDGKAYEERYGRDNVRDFQMFQHDLAATIRWDVTTSFICKAEVHLMDGTGLVYEDDNDTRSWWLLAVKSTFIF